MARLTEEMKEAVKEFKERDTEHARGLQKEQRKQARKEFNEHYREQKEKS